jgi:DcmR-like sensory protein
MTVTTFSLLTDSGLPQVGRIPWGSHFSVFYETRTELMEVLTPFFLAGLRNRERCVWITAPPFPAPEKAAADLAAIVPDLHGPIQGRQILVEDYRTWYRGVREGLDPEGLAPWIRAEYAALSEGYSGLRVLAILSWLKREQWRDFCALEAGVNKAFHRHRIIALCAYDLERCGANDTFDVIRNHHFAFDRRNEEWEILEVYPRPDTSRPGEGSPR